MLLQVVVRRFPVCFHKYYINSYCWLPCYWHYSRKVRFDLLVRKYRTFNQFIPTHPAFVPCLIVIHSLQVSVAAPAAQALFFNKMATAVWIRREHRATHTAHSFWSYAISALNKSPECPTTRANMSGRAESFCDIYLVELAHASVNSSPSKHAQTLACVIRTRRTSASNMRTIIR